MDPMEMRLNLDCLGHVMDHVDTGTLFSLLTTNRRVFGLAVRKLWERPFERAWERTDKEKVQTLYKIVLRLSPSNSEDVEGLRTELGLDHSAAADHDPPPFVDYISFIRHACFDSACRTSQTTWFQQMALSTFLIPSSRDHGWTAILWAACSHRLPQIVTLQVCTPGLHRIQAHIDQLTALERLVLQPTGGSHEDDGTDLTGFADFVKALIDIHGPQKRRLEITTTADWLLSAPTMLDLLATLDPPSPSALRVLDLDTWTHCSVHMDAIDFSHVQHISLPKKRTFFGDHYRFTATFVTTVEKVLPYCRNLKSLAGAVCCLKYPVFEQAVLHRQQWEQDHYTHPIRSDLSSSSPAHGLTPPPPPLKKLQLHCSFIFMKRTLNDAIIAFGPTLEDITFICGECRFSDAPLNRYPAMIHLGVNWHLPKLRHLEIHLQRTMAIRFDPEAFTDAPCLETLVVQSPAENQGFSFSDHFCLSNAWNLPHLRKLHLEGPAAVEFSPASFYLMPNLEQLTLCFNEQEVRMPSHEQAALAWPRAFWTWGWDMPRLLELTLMGQFCPSLDLQTLSEAAPMLKSLTLVHTMDQSQVAEPLPWLEALRALDAQSSMMSPSSSSSFVLPLSHPTLQTFRIGSAWPLGPRNYRVLLHPACFPQLRLFEAQMESWPAVTTALSLARHHPGLDHLLLSLATDDDVVGEAAFYCPEALEALGLIEDVPADLYMAVDGDGGSRLDKIWVSIYERHFVLERGGGC
ncbi:hypothetical protein BGZ73_005770 [Actinomortierella ambigua]|nr:hypothetical protein BGZ73_005770 [Actinomortierella ambigua]